jgi:hypothetical protein
MTSIGNDTQLTNHIYRSSGDLQPEENRANADHKAGNKTPPASDKVDISEEARSLHDTKGADKTGPSSQIELTEEEQREVEELQKKDREVKAHEMAHVAAGGGIVRGAPTYEYQTGPDGKRYAVGGHVNIDTAPEKTPEKTIQKMQKVKRAALAPADPSGTDLAVAAKASRTEAEARSDRVEEKIEESMEKKEAQDKYSPENELAVQGDPPETPAVGTTLNLTV